MTAEKLDNDQTNVDEAVGSTVNDEKKEGGGDASNVSASDDKEPGKTGDKEEQEQNQEEVAAQTMTLDVAYQSLEMVRKVNLQVEFGEQVDDSRCVGCLRSERASPANAANNANNRLANSKFGQWVKNRAKAANVSQPQACLTCGTPVCKAHRSSDFGKQNIAICLDCANLFSMKQITSHIVEESDAMQRKSKLNHMLEVYDRSLLVLTYSDQFIDDIVVALQGNTERHNMVGVGSSATGVLSGGLGVAAACTIFTPVGPPLLLASILFGGGATAVNAGSEAVNYRSEPNTMADKILTLYSFITRIAELPGVIEMEDANDDEEIVETQKLDQGQSRLHMARTAMHTLKPLTAGALSAVSIVTEAREMKNTVDKIRAGNPCEKAERLLKIKKEIPNLPHTNDLTPTYEIVLDRHQKHQKEKQEKRASMTKATEPTAES